MKEIDFFEAYRVIADGHLINSYLLGNADELNGEIYLLHDDYDEPAKPGCIYVGSWRHALKKLPEQGELVKGFFVICRNPDEPVIVNKGEERAAFIEVDLPMAEAYNTVIKAMKEVSEEKNAGDRTTAFLKMAMSGELRGAGRTYASFIMKDLPYPFEEDAFIIVVRREKKDYPEDRLIRELTSILPNANIGRYENDIVVILPAPHMTMRLSEELEASLQVFLEQEDCIAAISNPFDRADDTEILYRITAKYMDVCKDIFKQERLFTSDYGNIFYAIHLCWKQFSTELGSDYFTYLTHPGLSALLEYDQINHTDLEETLFTYLLNNCSFTKTAEKMYVHRNTVINKMKRIKTIVHDDLSDPVTIFKMLFSHVMLLHDREFYLNRQNPFGTNA